MLKRIPSRNQRSKGVRLKHVLQICALIGVCFWLVYQIKHSHEKQKEFDETGSKISTENKAENVRLGRKDLPQENPTRNENSEETDDVDDEEDEETKNDRSGIENENENEENDDDDVDNRMEKKDEDSVEENDDGDSNDQTETVDSSDHEAREEHYRGDDASSEVTHEGEDEERQDLEDEAPDMTMDDNTHYSRETDDDGYNNDLVSHSKNVRHSALSSKQSNEHEGTESNDQNNNNVIVQADTESSNRSFVENDVEISDSSQPNGTKGSVSDPGLAQNVTNSVDSENIRVEPNSTVSSETDYKDEVSKDKMVSNGTVETEEREGSSEKLEETVDPAQPELIDSTDTQISQQIDEAQTDLETLPDFTKPLGNLNDKEEMMAE